jgi:hypothetical protein
MLPSPSLLSLGLQWQRPEVKPPASAGPNAAAQSMVRDKMASMKGVVAKYNAHLEAMYGGVKAEGAKGLPLSGKIRYIMARNDMTDAQEGPVRPQKHWQSFPKLI